MVQLCSKRAEQIREQELEGDDEYPPTLNNIIDRKLLLKINVKSTNIKQFDQIYTVMKICDDEEIIKKNTQSVLSAELSTNNIKGGSSNSVHVSRDVVNLKNDCDLEYNLDAIEESISSLKCKIPLKRTSNVLKCGSQFVNETDEDGYRKGCKRQKVQSGRLQGKNGLEDGKEACKSGRNTRIFLKLGDATACSMRPRRSDEIPAWLNSRPANSGLFLTQFSAQKTQIRGYKVEECIHS
ncbi:hypothetical protein AHAS_Ahas11G0085800 [Arachis hypogaea]